MALLEAKNGQFWLEGKPLRIISGAIHYFRTVPEHWRDRLIKLKACGFNTVETYVAWNVHEPTPGKYDFEGIADVEGFIRLAGELGLHVIVRPSPYICAEWEFGGLPAWLLADSDMRLRCFHKPFLDRVDAYYDVLLPKFKPLLSTNGGPIIAMQIENEYGSYGNDAAYLDYLRQGMIRRGIDVLLFTSDGPTDFMLQGGSVPGVVATANFGSRVAESFQKLGEYEKNAPMMCMEFWNGWFDHWGEHHHTRSAEDVARLLDEMLQANASVNFYMFHGGTNFGFYSGANSPARDRYQPTITSYDYDVLLSEAGEPTEKFYAVRDVLARHGFSTNTELPASAPKRAYGVIRSQEQADLLGQLDALSQPIASVYPQPMEKFGQNFGFIYYETFVPGPREGQPLHLQEVADRALVFINDRYTATIDRGNPGEPPVVSTPKEGMKLGILVENMGRINYGPYMLDRKGITEGVRLGNPFLFNWTVRTLPLGELSGLDFKAAEGEVEASGERNPTFHRALLETDEPADTYLHLPGWTKGVVWVNGFNIGTYWNKGPQQSLYIPGPLLQAGSNEIVVLELHGTTSTELVFKDEPDLGPTR